MNSTIESAKGEFERAVVRLTQSVAATPDEKIDWSPAPTARTPIEIAFHCTEVINALHGAISGTDPMPAASPVEMDTYFRTSEMTHGSRDEVVKKLKENAAAYTKWLDELPEEKLAEFWASPFGEIPYSVAITLPAYHTANHTAQLEYIQTIYGDRVWH